MEKVRLDMDDVAEDLKQEANYNCKFHHWPEELARREYNKAVSIQNPFQNKNETVKDLKKSTSTLMDMMMIDDEKIS